MSTTLFNTADVQSMVGVKITAEYIIGTLGVKPEQTDKRAMFWTRNQVGDIANLMSVKLGEIAESIIEGEIIPAPREKKPAAAPAAAPQPVKSAAEAFDDDDDDL